jgi:hypothetical protein
MDDGAMDDGARGEVSRLAERVSVLSEKISEHLQSMRRMHVPVQLGPEHTFDGIDQRRTHTLKGVARTLIAASYFKKRNNPDGM